jgi:hypothetical protein
MAEEQRRKAAALAEHMKLVYGAIDTARPNQYSRPGWAGLHARMLPQVGELPKHLLSEARAEFEQHWLHEEHLDSQEKWSAEQQRLADVAAPQSIVHAAQILAAGVKGITVANAGAFKSEIWLSSAFRPLLLGGTPAVDTLQQTFSRILLARETGVQLLLDVKKLNLVKLNTKKGSSTVKDKDWPSGMANTVDLQYLNDVSDETLGALLGAERWALPEEEAKGSSHPGKKQKTKKTTGPQKPLAPLCEAVVKLVVAAAASDNDRLVSCAFYDRDTGVFDEKGMLEAVGAMLLLLVEEGTPPCMRVSVRVRVVSAQAAVLARLEAVQKAARVKGTVPTLLQFGDE